MARQIENGMDYTMLTRQYRMTAGVEELSSRMCYGGRLENAAKDNDTFEQGGASAGEDGDISARSFWRAMCLLQYEGSSCRPFYAYAR